MNKVRLSTNLNNTLSLSLSILLVSFLPLISSCFDCREYVPQQFKFGSYLIHMNAPDKVHVGDKILVSVNLPRAFYDSISHDYIDIDRKVDVSLKLDKYVQYNVDSTDVFATPRTIFHEFDSYFDLKVLKGQSLNVYRHECVLADGRWILELEYVPKQKGAYYFDPNFMVINTSRADLPKGVCDEGDPLYDARILFSPDDDQIDHESYFGFVVE
jgi:hypothetical protein